MRKAIVFIAAGLILVIIGITLSKSNLESDASPEFQTQDSLDIENKTRAFSVISAVRDGGVVHLSFRNDYPQAINAFTLAGGANSGVQVDLVANDHRIAPGQVYDYRIAAISLEPSGSPVKPVRLTVLNVVFEDGTGDGDYEATLNINNRRRGEKIALTRIVPLLETASKMPDSETAAGLQRLKHQITALCKELAKENSGEVQGGILHGQGYVLEEIAEAERQQKQTQHIRIRDELSKIKQRFEKRSARLRY